MCFPQSVDCGKITEQTSSKKVQTPTSTASKIVQTKKSSSYGDTEKPTSNEPNKSVPASSTSKVTGPVNKTENCNKEVSKVDTNHNGRVTIVGELNKMEYE
ncbi:hypothetical protein SAMN02799633_03686 [Bacillus sp. UNCCL81]|nr:hypothetical protein SAMN02799633_03686 [Bacillus sp. UNCCL81]